MTELPLVNDRIGVTVADWDVELSSRVEDVDERWLVLAMPTDGVATYVLPVGRQVEISWLSRRGPATLTGTVAGRAPVRVPAFLVELGPGAEVAQRREHVRAQALLDVDVAPIGDAGPARVATTLDLSGGGALAHVPGGLALDQRARLTLRLPGGPPVEAVVRVVREAGGDTLGLRFELLPPNDRERVIRYVFSRLASALHVREEGR